MRQLLEEQVERRRSEVEDLKLKLSEEKDRIAFLEREHTCLVEVGNTSYSRDALDIRFRLAGYPAILSNLVPALVVAKMVPCTEISAGLWSVLIMRKG